MTSYYRGKNKSTSVWLKERSDWLRFICHANTLEPCKISKLATSSIYWAINEMLIHKITAVKMCMSLRIYYDVIFAANDAAT